MTDREIPSAIVLAGGAARRFGGTDKIVLQVGGVSVLDRVLAVLAPGVNAIVVGAPRAVRREARFVLEDPPGGGPVAGLAAGLSAVSTDRVYLLAGDLPFVTRAALQALSAAVSGHDGAVAIDASGRDQPLLSCWSTARLRAAVPADPAGAALSRTLAALDVARVPLAGHPPPWWDCDTPEAWEQAKEWVR